MPQKVFTFLGDDIFFRVVSVIIDDISLIIKISVEGMAFVEFFSSELKNIVAEGSYRIGLKGRRGRKMCVVRMKMVISGLCVGDADLSKGHGKERTVSEFNKSMIQSLTGFTF